MPRRGEGAGGAPESILEPLQNQQKPGTILLRQPPETSEILPPAPTRFFLRDHDYTKTRTPRLVNKKSVRVNILCSRAAEEPGRGASRHRSAGPGPGISARSGRPGNEAPRPPDILPPDPGFSLPHQEIFSQAADVSRRGYPSSTCY